MDNKTALFFLLFSSALIFSCVDDGDGGGGTGGGGGGSLTSSTSLLSGTYSIDPNDTALPPTDDPGGPEDPGLSWNDDAIEGDSRGSSDGEVEANVYRGETCFPNSDPSLPPQIPCSSFSVCAFTIDGTPQMMGSTYKKIKNGKRLENIYINIKVNYLTPSYAQHWDELGWKTSSDLFIVPIVLSGKVQYTKDILGSALVEEDVVIEKQLDRARGPELPPKANTILGFKNIANQYAFTSIYTDNLLKSGTLARFFQQLWRTVDAKRNKSESSLAGDIPKLKKVSLKIPLRKDPQGNWHYQEVMFRNVMVHRVLWGPEPSDFKGTHGSVRGNGCYQYLSPGTHAPWNGNNFYNEQGYDAWWKTQWEVPWQ